MTKAVNIAGTSGAGKTHLARAFLAWMRSRGGVKEIFVEDREAPYGYEIRGPHFDVYVLGSYNTPTGGCDTFKNVEDVFEHVLYRYKQDWNVLYEGLFVMNMTRGPVLAEALGEDLCILQLTTPLATCIASVDARRAERGKGKLLKKDNTRGNYTRAENYCAKMRGAGAQVIKVRREEALLKLLDLFGG